MNMSLSTPLAPCIERLQAYKLADFLRPELHVTQVPAQKTVIAIEAADTILGYEMVDDAAHPDILSVSLYQEGERVIFDFGRHVTGYLHFTLGWQGRGNDAPTRLRLIYGEVPADIAEPLFPYQGKLSAGWLPEEIIYVDYLPQSMVISRRHAFRYLSIELQTFSRNFSITLSDVSVKAVTSAKVDRYKPENFDNELWRKIDAISLATLSECMQTCFEDGPRRDQRLWLGDLRLQALTNYISFEQNNLVKRCLYLFAGSLTEHGLITACVYEKPQPQPGEGVMLDYAALFGPTLSDYHHATGDAETANQLFGIALNQLHILAESFVDEHGAFNVPKKPFCFVDWQVGLDKQAAMQGIIIYSCRQVISLAEQLGRSTECINIKALMEKMLAYAKHLWDEDWQCFVSGEQRQLSWASQIWLVLADAVPLEQQQIALTNIISNTDAVKPMTPYLYHHMVSALIHCGLKERAKSLIIEYWGKMAEGGVDTFWEAFSVEDGAISPYGSKHVNSYCHAWSCTPAYFIRHNFSRA